MVLKSESPCLSCGDGRMTLEAASEALDRSRWQDDGREEGGGVFSFLPSSHGNLLPCPVLMCNRGVRHGQPLTKTTGPLSLMGTGSNGVGRLHWLGCWAVHLPRRILTSLTSLHGRGKVLPGSYLNLDWHPLLCRSLARAASTDVKPWQPANASPVSWLASRSTAFASSHKLGDRGFGSFCWESTMNDLLFRQLYPPSSKARWKPDTISARVCQTRRLPLVDLHSCFSSAPDIIRLLPSVSPASHGIGGCPGRPRTSAFPRRTCSGTHSPPLRLWTCYPTIESPQQFESLHPRPEGAASCQLTSPSWQTTFHSA